jgi:hypothetical protein
MSRLVGDESAGPVGAFRPLSARFATLAELLTESVLCIRRAAVPEKSTAITRRAFVDNRGPGVGGTRGVGSTGAMW